MRVRAREMGERVGLSDAVVVSLDVVEDDDVDAVSAVVDVNLFPTPARARPNIYPRGIYPPRAPLIPRNVVSLPPALPMAQALPSDAKPLP